MTGWPESGVAEGMSCDAAGLRCEPEVARSSGGNMLPHLSSGATSSGDCTTHRGQLHLDSRLHPCGPNGQRMRRKAVSLHVASTVDTLPRNTSRAVLAVRCARTPSCPDAYPTLLSHTCQLRGAIVTRKHRAQIPNLAHAPTQVTASWPPKVLGLSGSP